MKLSIDWSVYVLPTSMVICFVTERMRLQILAPDFSIECLDSCLEIERSFVIQEGLRIEHFPTPKADS